LSGEASRGQHAALQHRRRQAIQVVIRAHRAQARQDAARADAQQVAVGRATPVRRCRRLTTALFRAGDQA
jgi:hypothetical protein